MDLTMLDEGYPGRWRQPVVDDSHGPRTRVRANPFQDCESEPRIVHNGFG